MNDKNPIEIRWHGRGGQGIKTAAFMLAEALIGQGKEAQGFPMFGPEKSGAPVTSFNRISKDKEKILTHSPIIAPDIVVILDPSMLSRDGDFHNPMNSTWNEGITAKTKILANTQKEFPKDNSPTDEIYVIDASAIARKNIKKPIPNTTLMGGLIKIMKLNLNEMLTAFRVRLSKKMNQELVEANIKCIKEGNKKIKNA